MRLEVGITGKTFRSAAGGTHEVLAPVKFAIQSGEVGVLIGPSGCGKSTMLRIILGLDHDFQGHITRPPEARIGMAAGRRTICRRDQRLWRRLLDLLGRRTACERAGRRLAVGLRGQAITAARC